MDSIMEGIVQGIHRVFGENIPVLREGREQEPPKPCFLLTIAGREHQHLRGRRYRETYSFGLRYLSGTGTSGEDEELSVVEKLLTALEYITAGATILRGGNMNYKTEEGVLRFQVDYTFHTLRQPDSISAMEELTVESGMKER